MKYLQLGLREIGSPLPTGHEGTTNPHIDPTTTHTLTQIFTKIHWGRYNKFTQKIMWGGWGVPWSIEEHLVAENSHCASQKSSYGGKLWVAGHGEFIIRPHKPDFYTPELQDTNQTRFCQTFTLLARNPC